ncbi:hypothetical protein BV20DRAFT_1051125 [Pilatotrama ljubarskyi]|nr:hypothetical protein BV20DRAFT_1051125 [Pilatotrama ljubarskyi]
MLLVHPSSQCDICLDPYTWSTPAKAPHAIQCGHIFCLDCLRSVSPTNCPLCRKGFNPERIKKLHVDKVNGDGSGPAGPMAEENELFRRMATLFTDDANPEDINALVEEVNAWLAQSNRQSDMSSTHPLVLGVTALHQHKSMIFEKAEMKKELERLRVTHERHVTVKNKDIEWAMVVERNMLQAKEKTEAELAALHAENARLQEELRRYTQPSHNPLPRPPEQHPLVASLTRQLSNLPSATQGVTDTNTAAGQNVVPSRMAVATVTAMSSQPRDMPANQGPTSVRVVDPPPAHGRRSKYKVTSTGEQLRQENRRRSHLIVPGAPPSAKVLPPRIPDVDSEATPRASASDAPVRSLSIWAGDDWPYDHPDPRPRRGEPAVWAGTEEGLREILANEPLYKNYVVPPIDPNNPRPIYLPPPVTAGQPLAGAAGPSTLGGHPTTSGSQPPAVNGEGLQQAVELQTAGVPYLTRSARLRVDPPDGPVSGRSPLGWRPGPAHKKGYVMAFMPQHGICWIPEKQASKMPVRARGTESRYGYVIAKEPSEVDEEWRNARNGASPPPNPLQLTGVPQSAAAGPSTSVIQREDEEALYTTAREESALFRNHPDATGRSAAGLPASSRPGLSAVAETSHPGPPAHRSSTQRSGRDLFDLGVASQPEPGQSITARPVVQNQVPEEPVPEPSPATSWGGTYEPSRRSSLSLQLNNFTSPQGSEGLRSVEQVSIASSFIGGPVSVDVVTDNASISMRSDGSRDRRGSSLLLNSRENSSRQVVSGLEDLEDLNSSLMQLADPMPRSDTHSPRSSASSRHSRQPSLSGQERDAHIGPRTGLPFYSSSPATHYSGNNPLTEPSQANPSPPSQDRSSIRSRAESTQSYISSTHSGSSQRSGQRPRRAEASTDAPLRDPFALPDDSWAAEPADAQSYSSRGPYFDSRAQGSQESIPRSLAPMEGFGGTSGSLLLSFEAPSTSAAVDRNGEAATGIHAPRPVSSRHSARSLFNGAWSTRSGH